MEPQRPIDIGDDRDQTAAERDQRADAHDEKSIARDEKASARDERAEAREHTDGVEDGAASADRSAALRDRQGGASDRYRAADDRHAASIDRGLSAQERIASSIDELTHAHRRDAGTVELTREIVRAKRTNHPYVLAFIDVDGLKRRNDELGHGAGDELLRAVVDTTRAHLRPYDLIVRFGGDEFLCGLLDANIEAVEDRFSLINLDLATSHQASVTIGLAELEAEDTLEDLVARADQALYQNRRA